MDRQQMFNTPITNRDEAAAFIGWLGNLSFHFEDSPATIIHGPTGKRVFTDAEIGPLNDRIGELYDQDWEEFECPIGFALGAWNLI